MRLPDTKTIAGFALAVLGVFTLYRMGTQHSAAEVNEKWLPRLSSFMKMSDSRLEGIPPMDIKQHPDPTFDFKAAMRKLNEERVHQDDPRLVQLIRDYYLVPPSGEPYHLDNPYRGDYSVGQTPFVDSRLNYTEGGFYIEAGALDGELSSTTLFFEKTRKWNGLLVEPDPLNYAALMKKHRKAYVINACLSATTYPSMLTLNIAFQRSRVVHGKEAEDWVRKQGIKKNEVRVQCFPLYSILLAMNQLNVDFFSLDVEGDELKVLKTIPWDKVNIKMLTVEFVHELDGYTGIKKYMEKKGYDALLQMSNWPKYVCDIILRKKGLDH